jgi:hypothetical protein
MSRPTRAALEAEDEFTESERKEIDALLEASEEDLRAGRTVPMEDVMREVHAITFAPAK